MGRNNLPDVSFCFNVKMRPSCSTLSNAFDMSRYKPQTLYPSSNGTYIPWVINNS